MKSKLTRFVGLALVLAATTLPAAFAVRPCGCTYCQSVAPETPCNSSGPTTCGAFLAVALCPAG